LTAISSVSGRIQAGLEQGHGLCCECEVEEEDGADELAGRGHEVVLPGVDLLLADVRPCFREGEF
jgi:hypothetical protein